MGAYQVYYQEVPPLDGRTPPAFVPLTLTLVRRLACPDPNHAKVGPNSDTVWV